MSDNVDAIRNSLLSAQWRKAGELELEGSGGKVTLIIRRPPPKATLDKLEECRKKGLTNDKHEPLNTESGLEVAAIMFAPMLFLEGAVAPLFTPEQLLSAPFFSEVAEACKAALTSVGQLVEVAKGKSEATPT